MSLSETFNLGKMCLGKDVIFWLSRDSFLAQLTRGEPVRPRIFVYTIERRRNCSMHSNDKTGLARPQSVIKMSARRFKRRQ